MDRLTIYMVRNRDGKYFMTRHWRGYEHCWTDLWKAKIFTKLGTARSRVTSLARQYPSHGTPVLVELIATVFCEHDEAERVAKANTSKACRAERREVRYRKRELERAERELAAAKARVAKFS